MQEGLQAAAAGRCDAAAAKVRELVKLRPTVRGHIDPNVASLVMASENCRIVRNARSPYVPPPQPPWEQYLQQSDEAWKRGDYCTATAALERGLREAEKAFGPEHSDVAFTLGELARLYQEQGRYAEAEPLYRRELAISAKNPSVGENLSVAKSLHNLAQLYMAQGRDAEAEPLYRRSIAIYEKADDFVVLGSVLAGLAALYQEQGRDAEVEPLLRRSLAIHEKALDQATRGSRSLVIGRVSPSFLITGPKTVNVASALSNLALFYSEQSRYAEAEPLYRRSIAIYEKWPGPERPNVTSVLTGLAELYRAQGRDAEAEPLLLRALAIVEKWFGPETLYLASPLSNLARLYRAQNKIAQALEASRKATRILASRFGTHSGFGARGVISEQRADSGVFEQHVALTHAAAGDSATTRVALLTEALDAAQLARASDTADQLARMAARQAAASGRLAQIARSRQDMVAYWERLDRDMLAEYAKPAVERQREVQLREQQQATRTALEQLDVQIEKEFPQYRELTDLKPLKLDAAQKLLAPDEALVVLLTTSENSFFATGGETFVWAVRRDSADFRKVALPSKELTAIVQRLRRQLDLSAGDPVQILAKPFDVAAANDLYKKLLGPFEQELAGVKHLIVVPDGPLQSLPLGVLVTESPTAPIASIGDHANVAWLAKKYAITTLPAVGSLRALRAFAKAAPAPDSFGGFGDPLLEGGKGDGRSASMAALFSRGAVADVDEVRKLARLPETADELRAIATALKAPSNQLFLGKTATETQVKKLDLTRFRNVAFATHGLVAGDFKGLAEPALVLTPPAKGSEIDDGLLTASEISQLKLNADWMILSACNTAAGDGTPGAEGFSGLTKAFFYAGTRSLLVSQWAVESGAAAALTTRMFEETSRGASKAEALRRSMLALMQTKDTPDYAHPAFWAPFVVVGEGNDSWGASGRLQ